MEAARTRAGDVEAGGVGVAECRDNQHAAARRDPRRRAAAAGQPRNHPPGPRYRHCKSIAD